MITINLLPPNPILGGDPGHHRVFLFLKPCVRCKANFPSTGFATCKPCLIYIEEHKVTLRKLGVCICKRPLAPGIMLCQECRDKYNKQQREKGREKAFTGVCVRCPKTIPVTDRYCKNCAKKKRKAEKKSIKKRKEDGRCLRCTNPAEERIKFDPYTDIPIISYSAHCKDCAAINRKRREDWDPDGSKQKAYLQNRRAKLLKKGMCICNKDKVVEGKTRCANCLEQNRITAGVASLKQKPKPDGKRRSLSLNRTVALLGASIPEAGNDIDSEAREKSRASYMD